MVGELIEKVEEIKKNIRTWGCGASRFGVMALSKGGGGGRGVIDTTSKKKVK